MATDVLRVLRSRGDSGRIRGDGRVVLSYDALGAGEVVVRHGMPATTVLRAAFDAVRLAGDEREAVVVLDMMAAARLLSLRRMAAYVDARAGTAGVVAARRALGWASEHSRSPNETRLRLCWERDAGLPPVHVNCPVHDLRGRLIGIADLFDEGRAWPWSSTVRTTEPRGGIRTTSGGRTTSAVTGSRWLG